MPSAVHRLTLANGLQVSLRHAPHVQRCAAALRVRAGSHDADARWPGLAHFLEHLLFLGTAQFPLDDGLMRYVQRQGGQVNASTRERSTDFFFELAPTAFAGGLERLCDMLARPRFDLDRQAREREVIHAEFIAWSRNVPAQRQHALLQAVSPRHPLSGFHAGNRFSLPLHAPHFQAALQGFHRDFYHGGQMTLSLVGPQSLGELERLARRHGTLFNAGTEKARRIPPPLLKGTPRLTQLPRQLDLLFACEHLPADAEPAIAFLTTWLTDTRPTGVIARLREHGWLDGLQVSLLYAHASQVLLNVHADLTTAAEPDTVKTLLLDWLAFLRHADLRELNDEYGRLQACRQYTAGALELARHDSTGQAFAALDERGLKALIVVLDAILGAECRAQQRWQMPEAEPLLAAITRPAPACPAPPGLTINTALPPERAYGVVYLRWELTSALRERLWPVLDRALNPLAERAARAAVSLELSEAQRFWQLRCAGAPAAVVDVVEQALTLLQTPPASVWRAHDGEHPRLIPIRLLLKQLPDWLVGRDDRPAPLCILDTGHLDALWASARWQGMSSGFPQADQYALNALLAGTPGSPATAAPIRAPSQSRWQQAAPASSENALLLFCPAPDGQQAEWRLLAHTLQGPFYQRLRVELQLGYAVFSALRQVQGCSGLLFGVQSPSASHGEILRHIRAFLDSFCAGITLDKASQQALAAQFDAAAMSNADIADWAWQGQLDAQPAMSLEAMQSAVLSVDEASLQAAARLLHNAECGWLCLANGPDPGTI